MIMTFLHPKWACKENFMEKVDSRTNRQEDFTAQQKGRG